MKKRKQRRKRKKTWRDDYKKLTGIDPLKCERCHVDMEFWFARDTPFNLTIGTLRSRYGPDKRALKHFGLEKSDRIPNKQIALKSA